MEENMQHFQHVMLYFKKGKNTTEMQKKICAVYGDDHMCQKWCAKFCAGGFSLDDAPWSGRQVEVDIDQIETLIENDQCYTTREVANTVKIPRSVKLLVKIKNVSFIL